MRVHVDTPGKDQPAARVDLSVSPGDVSDAGDPPAVDADIRTPAAARGDDGPAADG
jgi:hypothetical protein